MANEKTNDKQHGKLGFAVECKIKDPTLSFDAYSKSLVASKPEAKMARRTVVGRRSALAQPQLLADDHSHSDGDALDKAYAGVRDGLDQYEQGAPQQPGGGGHVAANQYDQATLQHQAHDSGPAAMNQYDRGEAQQQAYAGGHVAANQYEQAKLQQQAHDSDHAATNQYYQGVAQQQTYAGGHFAVNQYHQEMVQQQPGAGGHPAESYEKGTPQQRYAGDHVAMARYNQAEPQQFYADSFGDMSRIGSSHAHTGAPRAPINFAHHNDEDLMDSARSNHRPVPIRTSNSHDTSNMSQETNAK